MRREREEAILEFERRKLEELRIAGLSLSAAAKAMDISYPHAKRLSHLTEQMGVQA